MKIEEGSLWTMLGHGATVSTMLNARAKAGRYGLSVPAVYDARRIKPLDLEVLDEILGRSTLLAVFEENYMPGGLGEAVAARIAETNTQVRLVRFGVPDVCVKHGTQLEQRELYGMTARQILERCSELLPKHGVMTAEEILAQSKDSTSDYEGSGAAR